MSALATVLIWLVALSHVGFMVLEMFLWDRPVGRRIFGMTSEVSASSRALAANQGLYNGFLAAGLAWALWTDQRELKLFFLGCVMVAGVYGGLTAKRSILFIQALPAALALFLVLLGGTPPAAHKAVATIDPARDVGIASLDTLRQCIAFPRTDLAAGTVVSLVRVAVTGDSTPAGMAEADVLGEIRRDDPGCPPELGESNDHWYRVHMRTALPGFVGPMFALVAPAARVTLKGPNAWVALGGDSALAQLRVCTSGEGLHLTAWRGAALHSARVFHRYYSLGYDVEPSCTEADWVVPKERGS